MKPQRAPYPGELTFRIREEAKTPERPLKDHTGSYPGSLASQMGLSGEEMAKIRKAVVDSPVPLRLTEIAAKCEISLFNVAKQQALATYVERSSAEFEMVFEPVTRHGRVTAANAFTGFRATAKLKELHERGLA
jgi:hypothetical protein